MMTPTRLALTAILAWAMLSACTKTAAPPPEASAQQATTQLPAAPAQPSPTSEFWEGVNYRRLEPPLHTDSGPGEVEVTELFWYSCPYCYSLEPSVEKWLRDLKPAYVHFKRIPVSWDEPTRNYARLFYAAQSLGRLDELHPLIFREIHVNRNKLATEDVIAAFFQKHGVAADAFARAFHSPENDERIAADHAMIQRYGVTTVPAVIVNGRFLTDAPLAGSPQQMLQLANELIESERRAQGSRQAAR